MQKLLFMGLLALFLIACGGNTQPATETSDDIMPTDPKDLTDSDISTRDQQASELSLSKDKQTFTPADLVGLYHGKVSNILGFAVIITESNGQLKFEGCESADEEELTMEMIKENPEAFPFTAFTTFELNQDRTGFTSDWGNGSILRDEYGMALVFEQIPGSGDTRLGTGDEQAWLYKVEE